jgi:hypothetical protein
VSGTPAGDFPNRARVNRLNKVILAEHGDEWLDGRCYFGSETMTAIDAVSIEVVGRREDDRLSRHVLGLDPLPLAAN